MIQDDDIQPNTSTCTGIDVPTPASPPETVTNPLDLTINPRKRRWEETSDEEGSDSTASAEEKPTELLQVILFQ